MHVPLTELNLRLTNLRRELERADGEWLCAVVMGTVNLYYLTGTMPSGALVIPRDSEPVLWVRRSYERACRESKFPDIRPMRSFRDIRKEWEPPGKRVHIEKDVITLAHLERFNKHFGFTDFRGIDRLLATVRAVKSPWELEIMQRSGDLHRRMLEDRVPQLLKEGMSELELGAEVYHELLDGGHHGMTRVGMFETELWVGNFCFGESAVYPNSFDGPGGLKGLCPAVPLFGSRERKLRKGDLVFVDVGCGVEGYHTDKTMVYSFGAKPAANIRHAHRQCVSIQDSAAAVLKPGIPASQVFDHATQHLPPAFLEGFMGLGDQQVNFLGHGVGLLIDELPIIAPGFDEPLEENMTIALEPKKGIPGVGMVGLENTFIVTPDGGISMTGTATGILEV